MLRFNGTCGMKEKKRYQGFDFVACFGGVKLEFGFDFFVSLMGIMGYVVMDFRSLWSLSFRSKFLVLLCIFGPNYFRFSFLMIK